MAEPSYTPFGAELRLRPFNMAHDAVWWSGPDEPPPVVLELLLPDGEPETLAFDKHPADLKTFQRELTRALSDQRNWHENFRTRSDTDQAAALPEVARRTRDFLREALGADGLERLNGFLDALPEDSTLHGSSDGLAGTSLLWAVMHPGDLPEDRIAAPLGFLGSRFVLVQMAAARGSTRTIAAPALDILKEAGVRPLGLVDDPSLQSVQDELERGVLRGLSPGAFEPLHLLPSDGAPPTPAPTLQSVQELLDYLSTRRQRHVMHVACHGEVIKDVGYVFYVRLKYPVGSRELRDLMQATAPAVIRSSGHISSRFLFLNICRSAGATGESLSPLVAMGYAGPKATIGALGDVCELSAAWVAMDFYDRAIEGGLPVGKALLEATRAALAERRNPANLMFVLAGDPELVLA